MILFLGSGVSLASGLPSVPEIQEELLSNKSNPLIVKLLQTIMELDSDYLNNSAPAKYPNGKISRGGQIFRTQTTYEDLYYLTNQVTMNAEGLASDLTSEAFTNFLCENCSSFLIGDSFDEKLIHLSKLCEKAKYYIEEVVARSLHAKGNIHGLDLILEMAASEKIEDLNIVTLNHDILVEQFLTQHGYNYSDGFADSDGDFKVFNNQYDFKTKIRIIKPHGSINWWRHDSGKMVQSKDIFDPDLNLRRCPSFLTGHGKLNFYNQGIYADQHFQFVDLLQNTKTIVMSGYGGSDIPYNFQFKKWLQKSSKNHLVLLHENPESLKENALSLAEFFDKYVRAEQIIPIKKWLSDVALYELKDFL